MPFTHERLDEMLALASRGIRLLTQGQKEALKEVGL